MLLKRMIALLIFSIYSCISFAQNVNDWPTYRTDGHSKSNGINLTIKYPSGWSAQEGARPHVVQKFVSPDGKTYAMILIQDLGLPAGTPISQEELEQFFTPPELKGMVPDGMQFINAQKTAMEGLPAGILEYKATMQRAGISVDQQVWSLNFIYDKSFIQLQFTVGGVSGSIDTAAQMQAQKPLFLQMANTVVLPDKWTAAASDSAPTATTTNDASVASLTPGIDGSNLGTTLLVSLLLTWGIGLTPPLLIRFVLLRRPTGKAAAIGLTALFWVFNLVLFTALGSQSKSHGALVLVALASYAILRKGAASRVSA